MNKINLTIPQGETYLRDFTVLDKVTTLPVNLNNYTMRMMIREDYDSPQPVVSLTSDLNGGLTLGGTNNNVISVEIKDSTTEDLVPGNYVYDLEVVSSSLRVTRLIEGKVKVTPEATKPN